MAVKVIPLPTTQTDGPWAETLRAQTAQSKARLPQCGQNQSAKTPARWTCRSGNHQIKRHYKRKVQSELLRTVSITQSFSSFLQVLQPPENRAATVSEGNVRANSLLLQVDGVWPPLNPQDVGHCILVHTEKQRRGELGTGSLKQHELRPAVNARGEDRVGAATTVLAALLW